MSVIKVFHVKIVPNEAVGLWDTGCVGGLCFFFGPQRHVSFDQYLIFVSITMGMPQLEEIVYTMDN